MRRTEGEVSTTTSTSTQNASEQSSSGFMSWVPGRKSETKTSGQGTSEVDGSPEKTSNEVGGPGASHGETVMI